MTQRTDSKRKRDKQTEKYTSKKGVLVIPRKSGTTQELESVQCVKWISLLLFFVY